MEIPDEKFKELLRKALRSRIQRLDLPPRLPMVKDEEYLVKIIDIVENPWNPNRGHLYIVTNLEDGETYRLPVNIILYRLLEGAKPGDYALIKYLGSRELDDGRKVNRYEGAVLSADEAEKIINVLKEQVTKKQKAETLEVPKKSLEKEEKEESALDKAANIARKLLEIYGKLTIEELNYYVNEIKKCNIELNEENLKKMGLVKKGDLVMLE